MKLIALWKSSTSAMAHMALITNWNRLRQSVFLMKSLNLHKNNMKKRLVRILMTQRNRLIGLFPKRSNRILDLKID